MSQTLTTDYPNTSVKDNLNYREHILKACEQDLGLRAEIEAYCAKNILYWVNVFCWTKDPRRDPAIMPFIAYPYENEHILEVEDAINNQYDLLNDKTRDMGVSWDILYVFMHQWLFIPGSDFRVGSRKEAFVDKIGDMDTLLEKVRFNLKRQPTWLLPEGFNHDKHLAFLKILNPENGNAIIGESANPHFGSGGRRKALLLDEFAKWDPKVAEAAWTATADVTNCRIPVSTPVGASNKFAVLARGTKERIKRTSLHWTLHPHKGKDAYYLDDGVKIPIPTLKKAFELWQKFRDKRVEGLKGGIVRSPWYDEEAERRKEADLAQEVDIDYHASGYPFFSLQSLSLQKRWEFFTRKTPIDPIPWGKHIRGNLVIVDHKVQFRETPGGWLKVFEMPNSGYEYILGGDTSEGLPKGDEAFGVVRDKINLNTIATLNGLFPPEDFAYKLWLLHQWYFNCKTAPENNNHGHTVCKDFNNLGGNMYYSVVDETTQGERVTPRRGFTTSVKTRPDMLNLAETDIRNKVAEVRDEDIIDQMMTFVQTEKGKPEADGDFLDDGVIAWAIAGQVIREQPYKGTASKDVARDAKIHDRLKKRNAGIKYKGKS